MENTSKLTNSILLLIVIFGAMGWIISYQSENEMSSDIFEKKSGEISVIKFSKNTQIESERPELVTDRYVNTLDVNDNVITIGSDGSMYNVRNGVVLADNMIIKKSQDESSNVRLHQLRNSNTQHDFN
jgi:hypothetical protein